MNNQNTNGNNLTPLNAATKSSNFSFLLVYDPQLLRLGALAEHYFKADPSTSLIKLRQFGEVLAQLTAARAGLYNQPGEGQAELLGRLSYERVVPRDIADWFHLVRKLGNTATHQDKGTHAEALSALRTARQLGVWFHRTFSGDPSFVPGPFLPPPDPAAVTAQMQQELAGLRQALDDSRSQAEKIAAAAEESRLQQRSAEERIRQEQEERKIWEQLANEAEQERSRLKQELAVLQVAASQQPPRAAAQLIAKVVAQAEKATANLGLDEASTRALIDQKLSEWGWEADSKTLRYGAGTRPVKGRNQAIAEWPTKTGPADYALFVGEQCIGVVEAKRTSHNVMTAIDQAERYAQGFKFGTEAQPVGGPWGNYKIPFVFATNGRPYLKQLETESGIWFRDVRKPTNLRRALADWPTPAGLKALLDIDAEEAGRKLADMPFNFGFTLRPYQQAAIQAVETALADDQRTMLLAMATGTGKTRLAIAMLYRLLTAKRFRRICFVVDRSALGKQAESEFTTTRIVTARTFAEIFDLKGLDVALPESETKVHICTIQGLVKRVLYASDPQDVPPVDQYDLMVVDECHRGYLLDREMSDNEMGFRDENDYVSKYRRVLEYFDAVKIGLTATPALHTVNIFGDPLFTYSYREAVVDGFLVDHDPPWQITTALSQAGIVFGAGENIELLNTHTGEIDLTHTPDELRFEVDGFNRKVITTEFNRVVAEELTNHIDPSLPGKTLVFAATDAHAEIVVDQLKKAFAKKYGAIEDGAVRKITGKVDKVNDLIRSFRNDALPKIAVTVDLLTTGVDVPSIENLVFLRRVNSRILYEQMLGRATRLCEDIGKESFRIFDAVDLYSKLQNLTEMKPVVANPKISLEQLFEEYGKLAAFDSDDAQAQQKMVRDQMLVKLRRKLGKLSEAGKTNYTEVLGEKPEETLSRIESGEVAEVAEWLAERPGLGSWLDSLTRDANPPRLPISHQPDAVIAVTQGYGSGDKPEDFLESFAEWVKNNTNQIAALTVVVQRPRELTRAQLKELKMALDDAGYSDANLRRAWQQTRNEDIAASVIGFVRQAALGDALIPYDERVSGAMRRILSSRPWSDLQRKWLKRIGNQIEHQIVLDRSALDEEPFRTDIGGFNRLDNIFGGQLEAILSDINEELWRKSG